MPRITISVSDQTPQPYRFALDREIVTIGRGVENDILIESASISLKHAEMRRILGGYELCDVGSTNGIQRSGIRHEKILLSTGMMLKVGDASFEFILSDEEVKALTAEKATDFPPLTPPVRKVEPVMPSELNPLPPLRPKTSFVPLAQPAGVSAAGLLFFLVLAAVAFFAGLSMRYQKETGGSLLDVLVNRVAPLEGAAQ